MKKTTTDKSAAKTPDTRKTVPPQTPENKNVSGQSRRSSSSPSQSREIDMIPVRRRQTDSAPSQDRQRRPAREAPSAAQQSRRNSAPVNGQTSRRNSASANGQTSRGNSASAGRQTNHRNSAPVNGQTSRRNSAPQRQVRRPASAKRRRNKFRKLLSSAALAVLFILCAILLVSGILRIFKGKDTVPPIITLNQKEGYVLMPWQEYEEEGFSASDDRDGDLTDQVERTVMEDKIRYRVSDKAGNESVIYREIPYDKSYKEKTGEDFPDIDIDDPNAKGKVVYLTFDDGPGPYTEELLETLDRYGVNVTFFVTGASPQSEDMIKKEDVAGHSVGVHTFSHDFSKIYDDDKAFWKDIDRIEEVVERQTGHRTNLMRFAGGTSNTICSWDLMSELTKQAAEKGFQYFDWNISSGDGGSEGDMKMVINNITSMLPSQETCVILCHDTKEYTVDAMKYLIPWLLDHGYDIQPLQFDSEPAHHWVED